MDNLAARAKQRRATRLAKRHRIDTWWRRCQREANSLGAPLKDYLDGCEAIAAIEAADTFDLIGGSRYA